jgi:hypothetical protein
MRSPLSSSSRCDATDRASAGTQPRGSRRRGDARRWALAMLMGCVALLVAVPAASAAGTGIEGTVTDAVTHTGLVGVGVTVYNSSDETFVETVTTEAGGAYKAVGLSEGDYKVEFSDEPTYVTQYYNDQSSLASANSIKVSSGTTVSGINAALKEVGRISGRVTNTGGTPLAGVDVDVFAASGEFEQFTAFTNANGEYTVNGLPEGSYRVGFFPTGSTYVSQYYNNQPSFASANLVFVTAAATTASINAALREGGKISGTVVDSVAHKGLAKIGVTAYDPGVGFGSASTNENGEYTVTGLSTGSYKLSFYWEESKSEEEACRHAPRCIPKYITQYFNGQPSEATANSVGAAEGNTTSGINVTMVPSAPVNTALPVITGTPTVGSTLSCSSGSWTGETFSLTVGWPLVTPFTYQWQRDGVAIPGATSSTYILQAADLGHGLVCEVTASIEAGKASAKSITFVVVPPVPVVTTSASKLTVAKNATTVSVACANAACAGSAEVIERTVIKRRKGNKRITKKVTTVLAKGSYSLTAGKTGSVTLRLTGAGKSKLAHARRHRLSAKLLITVRGGKQLEKTVLLVAKK